MKNSSEFFQNHDCEYFPCHKVSDDSTFNCLFCYCPLYALGRNCGGNCKYTEKGVKDCSDCTLPHSKGGYEHIKKKFPEIVKITK